MAAHRLFREAALRRHLERRAEVHLPAPAAPRVIVLSWAALGLVGALVAAGLCGSVPDDVPGQARPEVRGGETVWTVEIPAGARVRPGQEVIAGATGEEACRGRVEAVVEGRSGERCGSPGRAALVSWLSACAPAGGPGEGPGAAPGTIPVRIRVGRRRLISLIPVVGRLAGAGAEAGDGGHDRDGAE